MDIIYTDYIWIIIGFYLFPVIFNTICARLTFDKNNESDEDFVKFKWNIDEDLNFIMNVIFVPGWNLICSIIYIIGFILNTIVKFITKQ